MKRLMTILALLIGTTGQVAVAQEQPTMPASASVPKPDAPAESTNMRHEIRGGAGIEAVAERYGSLTSTPATTDTLISASAEYGYFYDIHLELLASFSANIVTGDGSNSNYTPMIGMAYNFSEDRLNSFYIGAKIGENFNLSTSSHSYNALAWTAQLGKRIALSSQVAWVPEISMYTRMQATSTEDDNWKRSSYVGYRFTPFQLAILF